MYQDTLTDRRRVPGPTTPDTLTTRNNLAGAYRGLGTSLRPSVRGRLADRERVPRTHHLDTLTSRNNLAEACGAAGRLPEAITCTGTPHRPRTSPRTRPPQHPDHPGNNPAGMYWAVWPRPSLYEETVSGCERARSDHPDTAITRDNLVAHIAPPGDNDAGPPSG